MTTSLALTSPIGRELLDDPRADPVLVAASLRNIARSNWLFGGVAAARSGVTRLLAGARPATATLVDVGTGLGDVPRAVARSLARQGIRLTVIGVELNPTAAKLATANGVPTVRGDGLRLPLPNRSVDIVLLSQVAHHLSPAGVTRLATEATRVARVGVVLSDLKRSRPAEIGFAVAARILRFDAATATDGVTSLRRGFRVSELRGLLARAGFQAECYSRLGSRIVATWTSSR